jgi:hypothetical protein
MVWIIVARWALGIGRVGIVLSRYLGYKVGFADQTIDSTTNGVHNSPTYRSMVQPVLVQRGFFIS